MVEKALSLEHSGRYASAADLRKDVERCLDLEPISLRESQISYRGKRLLQRHPVSSTLAALAVAALIVLLFALDRERWRAQQEAFAANRISDFLVDTLSFADPVHARGEEVSVLTALQSGTESLDAKLAGQPVLQARIKSSIGVVLRNLGKSEEAATLHREAVETLTEQRARSPQLARSLLNLGTALNDLGEFQEGEARLEQSIALLRALGQRQSTLMVEALNHLSLAQYEQIRDEEALATNGEAAEIDRELGQRTDLSRMLVHNRGLFLGAMGRREEAFEVLSMVAEERREVLGADHPSTLSSQRSTAVQASALGEKDTAAGILERVLVECRRVYGDQHIETAVTLNELASIRHDQARFDLAGPLYKEAIETARELGLRTYEPTYVNNLATLYRDVGDPEQAARLFQQSAELRVEVYGKENPRTLRAEINLASALTHLGQFEEAGDLLAKARQTLEAQDGDHSRLVATSVQNDARRLLAMERPEAALERFVELEEMYKSLLRTDHPAFGTLALDQGRARLQLGELDRAEAELSSALDFLQSLGPDHLRLAETKVELADVAQAQGKDALARSLLSEAVPVLRAQLREGAPQLLRLAEVQRSLR